MLTKKSWKKNFKTKLSNLIDTSDYTPEELEFLLEDEANAAYEYSADCDPFDTAKDISIKFV